MSRNKQVLTATISPMTRRQLDILVEKDHLFASGSDAIDKAIGILYYAVHHDVLDLVASETGVTFSV